MNVPEVKRVAIIGAGAAGLVSANILIQNGFQVTVYEKSGNVGGVWNYAESNAMYGSLRTNLPKEIMAFGIDDPFTDADLNNCDPHSFLTHYEVQRYLERYAHTYNLRRHIRFNHSVEHVYKQVRSNMWTIEVSDGTNITTHSYDAVLVCNGHFNTPYTPEDTPGYTEYFQGESYHSSQYDAVKEKLTGKNVLVVGSMSSGTDMARELVTITLNVYVSDRSSTLYEDIHTLYEDVAPNLHILPGIHSIQEDGSVLFTNGANRRVDVILWCTGYLYEFPFLSKDYILEQQPRASHYSDTLGVTGSDSSSKNENLSETTKDAAVIDNTARLSCPVEIEHNRCVRPLYQQLFAIQDPTLLFVGLPFRVVPFPLFYYQAQYVAAVFSGRTSLPSTVEQYQWLDRFESQLRDAGMYETKYHFLGGPPQWEYYRFLAEQSGLIAQHHTQVTPHVPYNNNNNSASADSANIDRESSRNSITTTTSYSQQQHTQYLHMLESIYDDNMIHRVLYPGAPDTYRERVYVVDSTAVLNPCIKGLKLMPHTLLTACDASAEAVDSAAVLLSKQWGGSVTARKAQLLQKNFSWLFVDSSDHNSVVGHVKLTPGVQTTSDVYGTAPSGILTSVIINEAYRGRGLGALLMHAIEEQALAQGYCTLILWTPDAMDFYSKLGYTRCEPRRALTTLVTSIESISAKSISKLEQLFAKRTARDVHSTQLDDQSDSNGDASNAQSMVWMQKRIRDEMPLQDISLQTIVRSIYKTVNKLVDSKNSSGALLYLHCSCSGTAHAASSIDNTVQEVSMITPGTTADVTLSLPWAQQVGPSCGIQAVRFAEHILSHTTHNSRVVCCSLSNNLAVTPHSIVENYCTNGGVGEMDTTRTEMPVNAPTSTGVSTCNSSPSSVLNVAIERQYTEQGAVYQIHHIADLLHRNQPTTPLSSHNFDAYVTPAQSLTAGQFCNILLGYHSAPNNSTSNTPLQPVSASISETKTSTNRNPALVILPYDRDSTHSTPCCQEGVAAHYALVCGFIILPAIAGDNTEPHISHTVSSDYCTEPISEAINPERVQLVAMHGLTWQPIVTSYTEFMASNAQLHCTDQKLVFNSYVPNLRGNMVVVQQA